MAEGPGQRSTKSQIRSTALKHALNIEEKKKLKARVADLVLEAYDLPSSTDADPVHPAATDVAILRECLRLFQPSDLDDLITERNIDDRCGYALCPRPNRKVVGGGEKVWNQKGGKDFKIVDRAEMERWCSVACGNRTAFIRSQLSLEPSWLREVQNEVKLLDEVGPVDDLSRAARALANSDVTEDVAERLQALSLERGDKANDLSDQVTIIEKVKTGATSVPPQREDQSIEGYRPRKVHFASNDVTMRDDN